MQSNPDEIRYLYGVRTQIVIAGNVLVDCVVPISMPEYNMFLPVPEDIPVDTITTPIFDTVNIAEILSGEIADAE